LKAKQISFNQICAIVTDSPSTMVKLWVSDSTMWCDFNMDSDVFWLVFKYLEDHEWRTSPHSLCPLHIAHVQPCCQADCQSSQHGSNFKREEDSC
jgi:hypothetical protein